MSDTNMLKLRLFEFSTTTSTRRKFFVSCRFCLCFAILASFFAPCESFAQTRLPSSANGNRTSRQTRRTIPNSPKQSYDPFETEGSTRASAISSGGVPAQTSDFGGVSVRSPNLSGDTNATDPALAASKSPLQIATVKRSDAQESSDAHESAQFYLEQTNGRYTFLRLAKRREDFATVRVAPNAQLVVVPRKNFVEANVKSQEESENESEDFSIQSDPFSDSTSDVSKLDVSEAQEVEKASENKATENVDDYVAFVLTNLDRDEGILLRDAQDGEWNSTDLLSASLIAEGLTTARQRAHYRSVYARLLQMLAPKVERVSEPFQKSEIVYGFLHQTALTSKYDLNCSSVAKALDTGVFNCVSATVLFNCFAKESGLNVAALETTGHAKSRVKFADSYLDIETTCSDWNRLPDRVQAYAPTRKKSDDLNAIAERGVPSQLDSTSIVRGNVDDATSQNVPGNVKDGVKTPNAEGSTSFEIDSEAPLGYSFTRTKRPMREITDVELVATIYYNVGIDYYQAGSYERAIASYIKAIQLAPNNHTILGNLKATLNNWAIELATKEKRYATAVQITLFGLALDPNFEEFKVNLPVFFHDWVEYLAKDNKWEEIERVQKESKRILAAVPE